MSAGLLVISSDGQGERTKRLLEPNTPVTAVSPEELVDDEQRCGTIQERAQRGWLSQRGSQETVARVQFAAWLVQWRATPLRAFRTYYSAWRAWSVSTDANEASTSQDDLAAALSVALLVLSKIAGCGVRVQLRHPCLSAARPAASRTARAAGHGSRATSHCLPPFQPVLRFWAAAYTAPTPRLEMLLETSTQRDPDAMHAAASCAQRAPNCRRVCARYVVSWRS
mmetsp:Transcript_24484/g.60837  ORF Transcript_24484/g.60837 Transcript_24484/m.60837 type:complete len:225 (+) Transcript_24484:558-1232(+)